MSERIVDKFETVEIQKQNCKSFLAARRTSHCAAQMFEKQSAVRQSGQRIVHRIVKQFFLGVFALGNVCQNAHRTDQLSVGINRRNSSDKNPNITSVSSSYLNFIVFETPSDCRLMLFPIVSRPSASNKGVEHLVRANLLRCNPSFLEPVVGINDLIFEIEMKQTFAHIFDQRTKFIFAFAKSRVGFDAGGYIANDT